MMRRKTFALAGLTGMMLWLVLLWAQGGRGAQFQSPEEARDALLKAAAVSLDAVKNLLGTESEQILRTGDPVQDKMALDNFNARAKQGTKIERDQFNPNRATLLMGNADWPFPIPIVREGGTWHFDVKAGATEVRNRIVGANELDAIEVSEGYVEAQEQYASQDWDGVGIRQFARKVISTPGKKDGLYWPNDADSPVAGLISRAIAEGYHAPTQQRQPYHGYLYKILTSQGPAAVEGARDYIVQELMIAGFALVAWPAEYGVSGYKTFIVNQDGVVYEKDLGPKTNAEAEAMTAFNPDETWDPAPEVSWEPLDE